MMDEIDKLVQIEKIEGVEDGNINLSKSLANQAMETANQQDIGKVAENQELLRSQLCRKYQVFAQYTTISQDVLDYIATVCEGNPLIVLSYFHNLLTKGFIEITKDQTIDMTKKLRSAIEYGDKYAISPQIQLPYEIFNYQSVFFDDRIQNVSRKAGSPYIVVAALYTLRVCSLIGSRFSTQLLLDSGVCPQVFQSSQLMKISLFKLLELLEEHDFIELIHEQQVKTSTGEMSEVVNRAYRFNHIFLSCIMS